MENLLQISIHLSFLAEFLHLVPCIHDLCLQCVSFFLDILQWYFASSMTCKLHLLFFYDFEPPGDFVILCRDPFFVLCDQIINSFYARRRWCNTSTRQCAFLQNLPILSFAHLQLIDVSIVLCDLSLQCIELLGHLGWQGALCLSWGWC